MIKYLLLAFIALAAPVSYAYPTSVFFAPTGESREFGSLNGFAYVPVNTSFTEAGPTWVGFQLGVLPEQQVGEFAVGGAELGIDVLNLADGPKFLFNGKLQLIKEGDWWPHVAVGILNVAITDAPLNLGYLSLTKSVKIMDVKVGRITAGLGSTWMGAPAFEPTWPIPDDLPISPIIGWESMPLCNVSFLVEHIGGVSEVGATNAALSWGITDEVGLAGGIALSNDPKLYDSMLFLNLFFNANLMKDG